MINHRSLNKIENITDTRDLEAMLIVKAVALSELIETISNNKAMRLMAASVLEIKERLEELEPGYINTKCKNLINYKR